MALLLKIFFVLFVFVIVGGITFLSIKNVYVSGKEITKTVPSVEIIKK